MEERSRRPHSNPNVISPEVEDLVVEARKLLPRRGARKLRAILVDRYPEIDWPSASSIGNFLRRRGLCRLKSVPPELVYRRSRRRYPCRLLRPDPPAWRDACDVDHNGYIRWRKHTLFL